MKAPLVVEVGPLRERSYTGIPNVVAELCTRLLQEDWLDLYVELDGHWIDTASLRRCLAERSGAHVADDMARFPPASGIAAALRAAGVWDRTVALYSDLRPPRKRYAREGKIVYDLSMILTPECHPASSVLLYTADFASQLACTDVIFCISEATRRDLDWIYGIAPDRLKLILLGNNLDTAAAERLRARIGNRPVEPFLLVLGSIEPRKNVAFVLQWLAEHPEVLVQTRVVFAGRQAWGETFAELVAAKSLGEALASGRIVFAGYVDEAFRTALMVGAAGLVYASIFEGFGLPLLEAMAVGTPVLHSVSTSLPEVIGDCGYGFDPCDTASLQAAFARLVADRASGAVAARIAAGRQRAAGFSYDAAHRAILDGLFPPSDGSGTSGYTKTAPVRGTDCG